MSTILPNPALNLPPLRPLTNPPKIPTRMCPRQHREYIIIPHMFMRERQRGDVRIAHYGLSQCVETMIF